MSPRRFERRTYMIVAPGWSALALKAAISASSASTTIRSAFPFTLSPTVNCQDILASPGISFATRAPILRVRVSLLLSLGDASRRTRRAPLMHKIKSEADAG